MTQLKLADATIFEAHQEYMQGASLADVGAKLGRSRERMRQLFRDAGLPTRSLAEARALRQEVLRQEVQRRRQEILDLYKKLGNIDAVYAQIHLPRKMIAEVVATLPLRRVYRHHDSGPKVSRERMIGDLRAARDHLGCDRLSQMAYSSVAASLGLISLSTQNKHFGSFDQALKAAGIPGYPVRGRRKSSLTREDCLAAVTECVRAHDGQWVSAEVYGSWAAANGKPSCPSVRNLVGRWKQVMVIVLDNLSRDAV